MPVARLFGISKTMCAPTVPTWRPPSWREPHHHPPDHEKECVGVEIDTPLMAACTFQHVVVLTGQIVRRPSRNLFTRSCVGASCLHAAKRSCLNRVSVCWNLAALSLHLTWRINDVGDLNLAWVVFVSGFPSWIHGWCWQGFSLLRFTTIISAFNLTNGWRLLIFF